MLLVVDKKVKMENGWKYTYEVLHEGRKVGFVEHLKAGGEVKTKTICPTGECIEGLNPQWLLERTAA